MEVLKFLEWLVLGVVLFIFLAGIVLHILDRRVVSNRYEWLEVLSHTEWKPTLQLRKEMGKIKGTSWGGMTIYSDLGQLEEEKLVEWRKGKRRKVGGHIFSINEYRLTPGGTRKKLDINSVQKEKRDLQLQPV